MKLSKITVILLAILAVIIGHEFVRLIQLSKENDRLLGIEQQYLTLSNNIEIYDKLKSEYKILNDENKSIDEKIVNANLEIDKVKSSIEDYNKKIDNLKKKIADSK